MINAPLPGDILVQIFCEASYLDIIRCRSVCRLWESVISTSVTLQYLVWLGIHAYEDGDESFHPRSSAERLNLLLDHERAWSTGKSQKYSINRLPRESALYLCEADLAVLRLNLGEGRQFFLRRLPSAIASRDDHQGNLLPRHENGNSIEGWTLFNAENELTVINPGLDSTPLTVRLRSLGDPSLFHPLARSPNLQLECFIKVLRSPGPYLYDIPVQLIVGEHLILQYSSSVILSDNPLGALSKRSVSIILVVNWITGRVISRSVFPYAAMKLFAVENVCIISKTAFVIPIVHEPVTNSTGNGDHISCSLHVYDFSKSSGTDELNCPIPSLLGIFALPILEDPDKNVGFMSINCACSVHQQPISNDVGSLGSESRRHTSRASKPFYPRGDNARILTVTVQLNRNRPKILFVTRSSTLLTSGMPTRSSGPIVPLPWAKWGLTGAGCISAPHSSAIATYGERVAVLSCNERRASARSDPTWTLELLDFNNERVRRFDASHEGHQSRTQSAPSVVQRPNFAPGKRQPSPSPLMTSSHTSRTQSPLWPFTGSELDVDLTINTAPNLPTEVAIVSPFSRHPFLGSIRYLRTISHLPKSHVRVGGFGLKLHMDSERIILFMHHVTENDDPNLPAEFKPDSSFHGPVGMFMEVFTF